MATQEATAQDMTTKDKINGKDLINIGIYAAIYCVVMTAIAMLGFIPVFSV